MYAAPASWRSAVRGEVRRRCPQKARERYQLDIVDVGYDQFEPRLRRARADGAVLAEASRAVDRYLKLPRTKLATDRKYVVNAFVLYRVFKELMAEHDAPAFTIKAAWARSSRCRRPRRA